MPESPVLTESILQRELGAGERLLWSGKPLGGLRLRPSDALFIPMSLLWGGFAIAWEIGVLATKAPWFFALWGVPFVLVGLYLIVGRFIVDARRRENTAYGLTDQRIIIISGVRNRAVKSINLRALSDLSLFQERNDRGTIVFGPTAGLPAWVAAGGSSWPGMRSAAAALEMIAQPRSVYEQIQSAQRSAGR